MPLPGTWQVKYMQTSNAISTRAAAAPVAAGIRVFLAEDHHITLWGLHRLIDASRGGSGSGAGGDRIAGLHVLHLPSAGERH